MLVKVLPSIIPFSNQLKQTLGEMAQSIEFNAVFVRWIITGR